MSLRELEHSSESQVWVVAPAPPTLLHRLVAGLGPLCAITMLVSFVCALMFSPGAAGIIASKVVLISFAILMWMVSGLALVSGRVATSKQAANFIYRNEHPLRFWFIWCFLAALTLMITALAFAALWSDQ
jgi:hypothetical protein